MNKDEEEKNQNLPLGSSKKTAHVWKRTLGLLHLHPGNA
jgi:hypothetical protein